MPGARTTIMWLPLPRPAIRTRALSKSILQVASAVSFSLVSIPKAASSCSMAADPASPTARVASAGMKDSNPCRAMGCEGATREEGGGGVGVASGLFRTRPMMLPKLWTTRCGPSSPRDTPSTSRATARLRRAKRIRAAEGTAPRSLRLASARTCHRSGRSGKMAAPVPTTSQVGPRWASRPAQGTRATTNAAAEHNRTSHGLPAGLFVGCEDRAMSASSMMGRIACGHEQSHGIVAGAG